MYRLLATVSIRRGMRNFMLHNNKIVYGMAAAMFAVLVALGVWQVQRLAWKEGLIARIDARRAMEAAVLPDRIDDPAAWEYRRVKLRGHFVAPQFLLQPRTQDGRTGYHLVMPFALAAGKTVFVNRGWVAADAQDRIETPAAEQQLEGVVQIPQQGAFMPENDPQRGYWYWPDLAAMGKAAGRMSDYPVIVTLPPQGAGAVPAGYEVTAHMRNNHRLYAFFWFGMAAILAVVFVLYRQKQGDA